MNLILCFVHNLIVVYKIVKMLRVLHFLSNFTYLLA